MSVPPLEATWSRTSSHFAEAYAARYHAATSKGVASTLSS